MTPTARLDRRLPRARDILPLLTLRREAGSTRDARRVSRAYSIGDLRRMARRRTPAAPFYYVDGGADDEINVRRARESYEDLEFHPRVLRDVASVDTATTVLNGPSTLPFGFGPTGGTRIVHAAGERAVVRSAARAGIPYALSTVGTTTLADFASGAPGARHWFQTFLLKDKDFSEQLIAAARSHGFDALIVTADVPTVGNKLRDLRNGMTYPPQLTIKTFLDASYRAEWVFNFLTTEPYAFTYEQFRPNIAGEEVSAFYDQAATFEDLAWVRSVWGGPIVLKGLQTLADVRSAVEAGVDGVVLSSHGGRQLDRTIPPLHLLPSAVREFGADVEIMVDSGIRSGSDIVAAVALGARFVLVGRAYLYGLMAGGEVGVDRAIHILRTEVERTMRFLGVRSISELSPEHVRLLSRRSPVT